MRWTDGFVVDKRVERVHEPKEFAFTWQIAEHVMLLAAAGWVTPELGERRRVRYWLNAAQMQIAQQILAALARDWDGPLAALQLHLTRADELEGNKGIPPRSTTRKSNYDAHRPSQ